MLNKVLNKDNTTADNFNHVWCDDFLQTGGLDGGSCCRADDTWAQGWCKNVGK